MSKKSIYIAILIITFIVAGYFVNNLPNKSDNPIQQAIIAIQVFIANHLGDKPNQPAQQLTVGIQNSPSNALIIIAAKKIYLMPIKLPLLSKNSTR